MHGCEVIKCMKFRGSSEKLQSHEIYKNTQSLKKPIRAKTGRPAQQVKKQIKRGNAGVWHHPWALAHGERPSTPPLFSLLLGQLDLACFCFFPFSDFPFYPEAAVYRKVPKLHAY